MRIFSFLNFFGKNLDNKPPIKFTKFDELIEIHKKYNFIINAYFNKTFFLEP